MTTQRLMEAQSGWAASQSAQNLLGATAQMRSATSEVDRASAMAPCMASSHCSFSSSDSAEKLGTQEWDGGLVGKGSGGLVSSGVGGAQHGGEKNRQGSSWAEEGGAQGLWGGWAWSKVRTPQS